MSFASEMSNDTDDLLDTDIYGEAVTIVRNTPTYGDTGAASDVWASVATPNADIQPITGHNPTGELGQMKISTHRIFLPNGIAVRQGDRIRPSGWVAGDNEYEVDAVLSDEGHVEVLASFVGGHG